MLNLHNVFREMDSLPPLLSNDVLDHAALKHAKRMARLCWLSDYGLEKAVSKLKDFKEVVWCLSLGSNPEIAVKKLINEPETRYHILGNYTQFGVGSFKGKNGIRYWTMLYGNFKNKEIKE
jgi:uncharacterized protein YkwD